MPIAAQQGQRMLPAKGRNPDVIGGNRPALLLQFELLQFELLQLELLQFENDLGVIVGGRLVGVQHQTVMEQAL